MTRTCMLLGNCLQKLPRASMRGKKYRVGIDIVRPLLVADRQSVLFDCGGAANACNCESGTVRAGLGRVVIRHFWDVVVQK